MTSRANDVLDNFMLKKVDPKRVIKNLSNKTVSIGDIEIGRYCFGRWKWEPQALHYFDQAELDWAKNWIMADN